MELKISEEYSKLVPALSLEEYKSLKESLKTIGQIYPVIVNKDGVILDGMHRWKTAG